MNALDALSKARQLLMEETPLQADCGRLCQAACCQPDSEGHGGMLLFPGEDALYHPLPPGFQVSQDPQGLGMLLTCQGTCERVTRPLACRMFPLFAYVRQTDRGLTLSVAMDRRAGAVCPLVEQGVTGLKQPFVQAVRQAARLLCQVPEHRQFLLQLTAFMDRTYVLDGGIECSGSG